MHLCWWGNQTTDTYCHASRELLSIFSNGLKKLSSWATQLKNVQNEHWCSFYSIWTELSTWLPSKVATQTYCRRFIKKCNKISIYNFRRSFKITWITCLHMKACLPAQIETTFSNCYLEAGQRDTFHRWLNSLFSLPAFPNLSHQCNEKIAVNHCHGWTGQFK